MSSIWILRVHCITASRLLAILMKHRLSKPTHLNHSIHCLHSDINKQKVFKQICYRVDMEEDSDKLFSDLSQISEPKNLTHGISY